MKNFTLSLITCGILITASTAYAVPVFSSPECIVKGIVKDSSQRTEQTGEVKTFNDATLYIIEQNYLNDTDEAASKVFSQGYNCDIKNQDIFYQLKDEFVTFKDPTLEKTLEGQCVQGRAKLSDNDQTLGLWLSDVQVLSPESCITAQVE